MEILIPFLLLAGLGIILGLAIGLVAKKFEVPQDPKFTEIRESLPGANCGGCGFAGCDAYAKAVLEGKAPLTSCAVGGEPVSRAIAGIMGVEQEESRFCPVFRRHLPRTG